MLISSEDGGGQIVSSREETRFYDDIACLAADWPARRDEAHAYVRVGGRAWKEASAAAYAQPVAARTAMGSDYAAFGTEAEARAADRAGRALTWDDVLGATGGSR